MSFLYVLVGVVLLYLGGEGLIRSASALGHRLGMSPLVVGLTVVALGTSAPELAASLAAALQGSTEMAFGNVVGSNIANLGLILALTVLIQEIRSKARFLRREVPFMIAVSVLIVPLAWSGTLSRWAGAVLLALIVPYLLVLLRSQEGPEVEEEFGREVVAGPSFFWTLAGVLFGSLILVLGAKAVVIGGTEIARAYGVSERVIGLTVLAVGTSLPELASSVVAAMKDEGDIVLGNLVGSNICNILLILGTTTMVLPVSVPRAAFVLDLPVMIGFAVALIPTLWSGRVLRRREGVLLLVLYLAYIAVLAFGPEGPKRI